MWQNIAIYWIQVEEEEISGIHCTIILYTFIFNKFYNVSF